MEKENLKKMLDKLDKRKKLVLDNPNLALESITKEIKKCLLSPKLSKEKKMYFQDYIKSNGNDALLMVKVLNKLYYLVDKTKIRQIRMVSEAIQKLRDIRDKNSNKDGLGNGQ